MAAIIILSFFNRLIKNKHKNNPTQQINNMHNSNQSYPLFGDSIQDSDEDLKRLRENGRILISTKNELNKYPVGTLISYTNTSDIFFRGGYLIEIHNDSFVYLEPDFDKFHKVNFGDVNFMIVGIVSHVRNDLIDINPTNQKKTCYKVMIGDTVVYFAKSKNDKRKFMKTKLFERSTNWYNYFHIRPLFMS